MIDCISVENMRESDAYTIEHLIPGLELMHRAAYGVFLVADWKGRIAILVGSGNNGGDGFALACILKEHGYDCSIFTVSQRLSSDSTFYAQKASASGVSIQPFSAENLQEYDILVDCLLGTGFRGSVRSDYRAAINAINDSNSFVISVDINSGMNGDTGEAEIAVKSDLTVTIGFVKTGLISPNAGKYISRLICVDIGIQLAKQEGKILSKEEWDAIKYPNQSFIPCPQWLDMTVKKVY